MIATSSEGIELILSENLQAGPSPLQQMWTDALTDWREFMDADPIADYDAAWADPD